MNDPMPLDEQLEMAQHQINQLPAGVYQVSEIFGEFYEAAIPNPQDFGKKFKKACIEKRLKGITLGDLNTGDKHWYYNIH